MSTFIADGDEPLFRRDSVERAPGVRGLDRIDAASPRIVRYVSWRIRFGRGVEGEKIGRGAPTETAQFRLDFAEHVRWQAPPEVRAQQRIVIVLIR